MDILAWAILIVAGVLFVAGSIYSGAWKLFAALGAVMLLLWPIIWAIERVTNR